MLTLIVFGNLTDVFIMGLDRKDTIGSSRRHLSSLWQRTNADYYFRFVTLASVLLMALLMVCDYFFLQYEAKNIAILRSFSILISLGFFFCLRAVEYFKPKLKSFSVLKIWGLLLPTGVWVMTYHYFLFVEPVSKFDLYLVGYFLVVGFTSFTIHRFIWVQMSYHLAISTLTAHQLLQQHERSDQLVVFILFNFLCVALLVGLRNEFINGLMNRFNLLNGVLPSNLAQVATLNSESSDAVELFRPDGRFVVCLCADWRGFQSLTEKRTAQEISVMLERFYDEVFFELSLVAGSGNYFLNWTADELFLIFYDPEDDRENVIKESTAFLEAILMRISRIMIEEFKDEVIFDVGVSSGIGLLGLLGPKSMKKTTLAGNVAGLAKRYQEDAKTIRAQSSNGSLPHLVIDQSMMGMASFCKVFPPDHFRPFTATAKNISGKTCYVWHESWAYGAIRKAD